ncbi:MAG: PKD domain-containing protein [Patescibacteria group bacterium]
MRPLTAFAVVLGVVVILATGLFFAVSWFGLSDLGDFSAQVKPSGGPSTPSPLVAIITTPSGTTGFFSTGQQISFVGDGAGGSLPYTYAWSFGDGTTDGGRSVTKSFSQAGTFSVVLTVTDGTGSTATDSFQGIVSGAAFTASITAPPNGANLVTGQTTSFQATASGGVGSHQFSWEFGDGEIGTGPSFPHAYSTAGSYTVTMRVNDSGNPPTQLTKTIQVNVSAPQPEILQAVISSPSMGAVFPANQSIAFVGGATGGSGSYIYHWDFGDGAISLQQNPAKAYAQAGTYTVELQVSDNANHQDTQSIQITISAGAPSGGGGAEDDDDDSPSLPGPLQVRIDAPSNNSVFQLNQTISFSGSTTGGDGPYDYRWDFGDGTFSTNRNATHLYGQAGNRTVTLTVTDSDEVTDAETITLTIQAPNTGGGGGGGSGGGGTPNPPPIILPPVLPPITLVPPPATCVSGAILSPVVGPLSFGMRDNSQVLLLQRLLAKDPAIYPEGIVSGFYGPLTRAAVQRFQLRYGILTSNSDPDLLGFAGPITRAKINQVLGGVTTCPTPVTTSPTTIAPVPTISTAPVPVITLTPEQRAELLSSLGSLLSSLRQNLVPWLVNLGSFLTP